MGEMIGFLKKVALIHSFLLGGIIVILIRLLTT